jgi:hypothetical protein
LEAVAAGKVREIAFSPKLAIASFIIRYLDWQTHNILLGQSSAMASIGLSGVLLNGIPEP